MDAEVVAVKINMKADTEEMIKEGSDTGCMSKKKEVQDGCVGVIWHTPILLTNLSVHERLV